MDDFLSGLIVALSSIAGVAFWRFWAETRDRLFAFFGGAFFLLAVNYVMLTFNPRESEIRPYLYLVRLAAFLSIIIGIIDKNRKTAGG